jgi:hypothetical protein
VSVDGESCPVGFPRTKRQFELTLPSESFKNYVPCILSWRGSIAVRRLGGRRVPRISYEPSQRGDNPAAGGGGFPETAPDPSLMEDNEVVVGGGEFSEAAWCGVEGVVIENTSKYGNCGIFCVVPAVFPSLTCLQGGRCFPRYTCC